MRRGMMFMFKQTFDAVADILNPIVELVKLFDGRVGSFYHSCNSYRGLRGQSGARMGSVGRYIGIHAPSISCACPLSSPLCPTTTCFIGIHFMPYSF
jgi:hypothetical protein